MSIEPEKNVKGLVGGPLLVGGLGPGPPGPPLNPALRTEPYLADFRKLPDSAFFSGAWAEIRYNPTRRRMLVFNESIGN